MRTILISILLAISIHAQDRGPSPAALPEPEAPALAQDSTTPPPAFRDLSANKTAMVLAASSKRDSLALESDRETRKAMLAEAKSMSASLRTIAGVAVLSAIISVCGVIAIFAASP